MSQIDLYCETEYIGEVFPGIHLIKIIRDIGTRSWVAPNDMLALAGRYGLVISNDPFIIFQKEPIFGWGDGVNSAPDNMTEKEYNKALEDLPTFKLYHKNLKGDFQSLGRLWEAIREAGYDPNKDGWAGGWICSKMAEFIETNTV